MSIDVTRNAKITKLPNGVRVATSSIEYVQSVTLGIWVGTGSRYEPVEMAGMSMG